VRERKKWGLELGCLTRSYTAGRRERKGRDRGRNCYWGKVDAKRGGTVEAQRTGGMGAVKGRNEGRANGVGVVET